MTKRKPPGVRFESFADAQIRKAREDGLFDDLPGKGKPLNTRDAYDPFWWGKQLLEREHVSMLPPALEIRRTVEVEMERIRGLSTEEKVRAAVDALNEKIRNANRSHGSGPPTTQPMLDAQKIVTRWRTERQDEG